MHETNNANNLATGHTNYDYATFPRAFVSYRWFKPLLVTLLSVVLYFVFALSMVFCVSAVIGDGNLASAFSDGYDNMNAYTGPGALLELGSIALILPSIALAALAVRDRPFSSYSSSRGGWNWGAFFRCLGVATIIMAISFVAEGFLEPLQPTGNVKFTPIGFVLCVVLVPLQCLAEEYLFRGLVLQTFASWTKLPVIGIIASAIFFAAGHPYNLVGVIAIFCNGLIWGFLAWKTRGLEAAGALHVANNMLAFLVDGFGLDQMGSSVSIMSLVVAVAVDIVFATVVLLLGKKYGWFPTKSDGAARFNEKKLAKMERKQQRRAQVTQQRG